MMCGLSLNVLKVSIPLTLVVLGWLAFWLYSAVVPADFEASKESVRLRNSLLAQVSTVSDFTWSPNKAPDDFVQESMAPPIEFSRIATTVMAAAPDDASTFAKAILIARHLKTGPGEGTPIMSSTRATYRGITVDGRGYCSDYTQVFGAIALAANLPVREWGMSFDGFGGDGHAFNEVYDEELGKWVFIDSFYSLYARDILTGVPVSALELRDALLTGAVGETVEIVPIVESRFGFKSVSHAVAYYQQGADQFYLYWGNNVFSYDANPLVKLFGPISRGLEQAAAIAIGVHPKIRLILSEENRPAVEKLSLMRTTLFSVVGGAMLLFLGFLWQVFQYRLIRRGTHA